MNFEPLFLQANPSAGAGMINFVFIGAMILIFYFFMIRPQSKKQKEQKAFQDNLDKGDEVVTTSGIIGRINKIEDEIITLDIGNKTFIRIIRTAISKEMTESVLKTSNATTTSND